MYVYTCYIFFGRIKFFFSVVTNDGGGVHDHDHDHEPHEHGQCDCRLHRVRANDCDRL